MQSYNEHEYIAFAFSALLHLTLAYLFFFGLPPSFHKTFPQEQLIVFEMLPVKDIINVPKQNKQQINDSKEVEDKKASENKESEKPIEKMEPRSEVQPIKEPEPIKPEIIPEKPTLEEKKIPPVITPPIEKKPETKLAPKPKKPNKLTDLDSLLKNLEKSSASNKEKTATKAPKSVDTSDIDNLLQSFNDESPLSITEKTLIKSQIQKHWHPPLGGHNAHQIRVTYHIEFNSDGSVLKATLQHKDCAGTNANLCEAFAASAERAIWQASPIENLPVARYNTWQKLNFNFDPSDLLR